MSDTSKPKAKKAMRRPVVVESNGVRIRLFKRAGIYWLDVRDGERRQRVSAKTAERSAAEANALAMAEAVARARLLGVTPETLTMAQLFTAYQQHKGSKIEGQYRTAIETRQRLFLAAWGETMPVAAVSQTSVDTYSEARRQQYAERQRVAHASAEKARIARHVKRFGTTIPVPPAPPLVIQPLRDGALDADFRWLSSVFNWGTRHKLSTGKRLLSINPLVDCKWPREKNVRRPVASHARYLATAEKADTIDPRGRLRTVLALARHTGRRESAIIGLRVSDVLLSKDRLSAALAAAGMDVGLAEHMPHGAIRWSAENDKMGMLHISPIGADVRADLERYLATNPRVGDLPLFPSVESDTVSMSRSLATKWLVRAETAAKVAKLVGGVWHPYRRLWATERQHLSDVSVAAGGGWKSTKTLKIYQQIDPAAVLAAVVNGR